MVAVTENNADLGYPCRGSTPLAYHYSLQVNIVCFLLFLHFKVNFEVICKLTVGHDDKGYKINVRDVDSK